MIEALTALAAHRLPGAQVAPLEHAAIPDGVWPAFLVAAGAHGLGGLLADAAHRSVLPCTRTQREEVEAAEVAALSACLALESALLVALEALAIRGIEVLVVNGSVGAHLDYPDPALRLFGDVDLLVQPTDLSAARTSLAAAGFCPIADRQPDRLADDHGRQVELHTHLLPSTWARHIPASDLWLRTSTLEIGGRALPVLAPEPRLVAACLQTTSGGPRLIAVRDVAQQVLGPVESAEVLETARRWRATGGVAAAIDDAWRRFALADVVALSVWAARHRGPEVAGTPRPRRRDAARRWLVRR